MKKYYLSEKVVATNCRKLGPGNFGRDIKPRMTDTQGNSNYSADRCIEFLFVSSTMLLFYKEVSSIVHNPGYKSYH